MSRPREFDVDTALEQALDVLWSKGYQATSLDDLCEATDLSRSSLYAAFGSKRDLLLKAIDRYAEQRAPIIAAILGRPLPIHAAFGALADNFIDQIVTGPGRRGCFLGNCAAELPRSDRIAMRHVRQGLAGTEAAFYDALVRAKVRAELHELTDIKALARFLTAAFQGLRLVGKVNSDRAALKDIAGTMLQCLEPTSISSHHHEPATKGTETCL